MRLEIVKTTLYPYFSFFRSRPVLWLSSFFAATSSASFNEWIDCDLGMVVATIGSRLWVESNALERGINRLGTGCNVP